MDTVETIAGLLRSRGISPTPARVYIARYLQQTRSHPTVETVYQSLKETIPSLSKTTVYNILSGLVKEGVVREVLIEPDQKRYEWILDPHAHFKCTNCGRIYDVPVPPGITSMDSIEGHIPTSVQVLFTGTCKQCRL
ncbi:MAG TPA: transcriptional repressor [Spirochaetales bacterium]|nr:transcriptional repressor [Spirochaetales bacterium]